MKRRDFLAASLASLVPTTMLGTRLAYANYPQRPVRLVVPRAPGGVVDVVARHWTNRISKALGTNVYIENIAGAAGEIGIRNAAQASPDGHTLLLGSTSDIAILPLQRKLSVDPKADFIPASVFAASVGSIAVHGGLPVRTLGEFVAYTKANPGKVSYASVGVGTVSHLIGEQFKRLAGLPDLQHVPYKAGSGAFADLASGVIQAQALFVTTPTIALHQAGKIRILAAASEKRLTAAPDIPTTAEAGFPDLIALMSLGVFAPKGTSESIVNTVSEKSREVLTRDDFQAVLIKAGFEPVLDSTPASTAAHFEKERELWAPIVAALNGRTG